MTPSDLPYIPLSVPSVKGNEWEYIRECLDTEWVSTAGTYVERFESEFSAYVGADYSVACVNGTAALQVALQVAGVKPGMEVLVPTLTFIATVNAAHYLGAKPVFLDCDDFYNLDVDKLTAFLENHTEQREEGCFNKTTGRQIRAIVPVHVFGNAARVQQMTDLCRSRGIRVVEDAAESLGTVYQDGRHTGVIGDLGCFSFNGNKIITCGGGGMIVTDCPEMAQKARYLTTQAKDDDVRYVHEEVGYNFRLTNIQAALGVAQLEQLPGFLQTKQRNYLAYKERVREIPGLNLGEVPSYATNNHWMIALQIESDYRYDREGLMARLQEARIQSRPVWHLNHLQKPYAGCQSFQIEKASVLLQTTLNIPCSTNLSPEDIDRVIEVLAHG